MLKIINIFHHWDLNRGCVSNVPLKITCQAEAGCDPVATVYYICIWHKETALAIQNYCICCVLLLGQNHLNILIFIFVVPFYWARRKSCSIIKELFARKWVASKLLFQDHCKGGEYLWLVSSAVQVSENSLCPKKLLAREIWLLKNSRDFCVNNFSHLLVVRQRLQGKGLLLGWVAAIGLCVQKHVCIFSSK